MGHPDQATLELTCFQAKFSPEVWFKTVECKGRNCGELDTGTEILSNLVRESTYLHYNASDHEDFSTILYGPRSFYSFTCKPGWMFRPGCLTNGVDANTPLLPSDTLLEQVECRNARRACQLDGTYVGEIPECKQSYCPKPCDIS